MVKIETLRSLRLWPLGDYRLYPLAYYRHCLLLPTMFSGFALVNLLRWNIFYNILFTNPTLTKSYAFLILGFRMTWGLGMAKNNEFHEFNENLRVYGLWAATSFIDAAFLALWVSIQYYVNQKVIKNFILALDGIDLAVFIGFQIFFAISTLAPVAIQTYKHIHIMIIRVNKAINDERMLGK